ncbi:unnamed protein product, partial [marine sediment metagenome]
VRAISILEKDEFPFADIVSHRLPLTRLKEAMQAILTGAKIEDRELVKALDISTGL